jgi:multidrug efflux pump
MNINLAGNYSLKKLKDYADQLKDEIESLPEITRVDIVGALDREIQINLDLYKMQAAGVSFYEIQNAIQGENINISGGEINVDNVRRNLRVVGEFQDVNQLNNVIIRSSTGATLKLSQKLPKSKMDLLKNKAMLVWTERPLLRSTSSNAEAKTLFRRLTKSKRF